MSNEARRAAERPESTTEADWFASVVTRRILKDGIELRTLQAQRYEIERILSEEFAALRAERDRYREALRKYADEENWDTEHHDDGPESLWIGPATGGPTLARDALAPGGADETSTTKKENQ